jgi:hypothetical protein
LARPFLASIHDTTREYLVPAIDGTKALQLVDGHGELGALPDGRKLTPVVPLPRFGAAMELKDPVKFVVAIERYIAAAKTLFDGIRRTYDPEIPPELDLPSPVTEAVAGGTLYSYRLPWDLGRDVCPCALLKGDLLVLASSAALAVEMAGTVPMPNDDVVATAKAAGELAMVDFQACHGWLSRLTNSVFLHMQQERIIGPRDTGGALVVKMHVDALLRSLRAFRGYRCLATLEDGRVVYHSWLHVEDVPE